MHVYKVRQDSLWLHATRWCVQLLKLYKGRLECVSASDLKRLRICRLFKLRQSPVLKDEAMEKAPG